METTIKVAAFVMGLTAVLLNKHLGKLTSSWQVMVFGRDFGALANRIPYIIVGVLAMLMSVATFN